MKPKVNIDGEFKDLARFAALFTERKKRFEKADPAPAGPDYIAELAGRLHPRALTLVVKDVRDETPAARTFRLVPDYSAGVQALPYFRAGQYLSLKVEVDGVGISRPYSISSSPLDALDRGYIEITVRRKDGGFLTEEVWKTWTTGTKVASSGPCGFFYHDPNRDGANVIALAGGSGITPFRSMIRDIRDGNSDISITLLYGVRNSSEMMFAEEFRKAQDESDGRIKVFYVASEPEEGWSGPTGFLTAGLIRELAGDPADKSFFICGPQPMYLFLEKELEAFNLPARRIRREVFGEVGDVTRYEDFPKELAGASFRIGVEMGGERTEIPARATETVLVSLERAGLAPPSQCRSGECGFCNTILVSGSVFVCPENDGRRKAGVKYGYFHPCMTYPVSDIEIRAPRP